jgi:PAS domain S-box-containing protein/diguanylate cyclase (GGDEF)-like protein
MLVVRWGTMAGTYPDQAPAIDAKRLHALHGYSLLAPDFQQALMRSTRVLAAALQAPIAFVGVVGQRRVTLTATLGIQPADTSADPGLCVSTVIGDGLLVIDDTHLDPDAANHPLVTGSPGLRFYAGMPLTTGDGFNLGTLCVADTSPRQLDERSRSVIADVAALLMRDIESAMLREAEDEAFQLNSMLRTMPVAHFTCRLDGTILTWSPAAASTFGYEPHQIIGQHVSILTSSHNQRETIDVLSSVAAGQNVERVDAVRVTSSGEPIESRDSVYPVTSKDGDVIGAAWSCQDVTELRRLETLIWEGRERFETIVETVQDAVVMTDIAGNVEYLNPVAQAMTGWSTAGARGKSARDVVDVVHEESLERIEHPVQVCLREGAVIGPSSHAMLVHQDGRTFSIEDVVTPVHHRDGTVIGTVMIFRDSAGSGSGKVTSGYLGNHDSLTGLPNRQELENQLERALVTAARDNVAHALVLLSVPQYSAVQIRQGQVAANELLKQVSAIMRTRIREVDTLARLEDDRFAVLLTHCPMDQAQRIASQLQSSVGDFTFVWNSRATLIGLRTTLLSVDADVRNASVLLDAPETAYDLVALRRDLLQRGLRPADDTHPDVNVRRDAGQSLNNAFADNRFRLYAQRIAPLTPVEEGDQLYEFLVHMVDDDGRLLSPSVFVGAAARDHHAVELDRWVVRSALASLKSQPILPASVWMINLSLASLEDETFADFVQEQLERSGVPAHVICFELSETIAIANLSSAMRFIGRTRQLGCRVSISQFGTSLHTFAYLRNLQVDYLKIDGSVIRDIADDAVDRAVVGAVGHIAHVMGIQTIAEHVEDIAILECLKDLGIDYAQGYAVSKPLPLTIVS